MTKLLRLCNGAGHFQFPIWWVLGSVRTNLGARLVVATSARPALAARGVPREWHEDKYWVADSGATKHVTQDSSTLEDYTPPPPGDGVEGARGVFLLLLDMGAYESWWTKITVPTKVQRAS